MIALPLARSQDANVTARNVRLVRPRTANQLHSYIRAVLGFNIPRIAVIAGHDAPFEYIQHSYFEDRDPRDMVVWANRGGGKTQLGAVATLLDLLFKPGIQIRILGGSFEQSSKMYRYLKQLLERDTYIDLVAGKLTGRHVELINGSRVEVLSQSECSVRGQRVHKVRCDELELFKPEIWEAAQLVTRSGRCGPIGVRASIEALSTMHRPFGMMHKVVSEAEHARRRVFRWSMLDTLQPCPPQRQCATCPLWAECQGRAKHPHARGFIRIDDAIQQKGRVGEETWRAEMLCERPSRRESVYPEFDERMHVVDDAETELCTQLKAVKANNWIGGLDFGFRAPTVLLWGVVATDGAVYIVDELVEREMIAEKFIELAMQKSKRSWLVQPAWIGADPAGHQRNEHTGVSTIALWKRAGWTIRTRSLSIEAGINAVRRRLKRADGSVGLRIHRRCRNLIESLTMYHYEPLMAGQSPQSKSLLPVKDGHDHAADALRYMIVNFDRESMKVKRREY
jgi:hypothetical protein